MTYAPQTLLDARKYLQGKTGLDMASLGIVGDTAHGTSGYHVGWDRLRLGAGTGDYSYRESVRDHVQSEAASALDIGSGWPRWRELTLWLVAQCQAGTQDTRDIREVIYTPDGKTVKRWDRLGVRSTGDSSHLSHTHISYHRDSEARDKTALFRRFFEGTGTTMAAAQTFGFPDLAKYSLEEKVNLLLLNYWPGGEPDANGLAQATHSVIDKLDQVLKQQGTAPAGQAIDYDVLAAKVAPLVVEQLRPTMPTNEGIAMAVLRQLLPGAGATPQQQSPAGT